MGSEPPRRLSRAPSPGRTRRLRRRRGGMPARPGPARVSRVVVMAQPHDPELTEFDQRPTV
jgi:hypothetical protein